MRRLKYGIMSNRKGLQRLFFFLVLAPVWSCKAAAGGGRGGVCECTCNDLKAGSAAMRYTSIPCPIELAGPVTEVPTDKEIGQCLYRL